jgi:hypothetical protein
VESLDETSPNPRIASYLTAASLLAAFGAFLLFVGFLASDSREATTF